MQLQGNEISHLGPREVGEVILPRDQVQKALGDLGLLGVGFDARDINAMYAAYQAGMPLLKGFGMDADLQAPLTSASVTTPIQFLQEWLPGFVNIITQAQKIDDLIGITTQGTWVDEEIVQGLLEHTGRTQVYGDTSNIPLSSWNVNFETRTIVRFEEGLQVGRLEEGRAARIRMSTAEAKRSAAAAALEIIRNNVGFFGYNGGLNRTYGILNDPNLLAYNTVPNGAGGFPEWDTKTYLEIQGDIRSWFSGLRVQAGGQIDPASTQITMGIALSVYDFLSVTPDFGNSVKQWLDATYPNTRVVPVPEFDAANGGANVAYLYAESVADNSSDDKRTFVQVVPAKFQTLGVEQRAKSYVESFSNATAGVLLKRPFAVYRATGI